MALHRESIERLGGRHERRRQRSWQLATGTLACPDCDAPVLPSPGGISPAAPISCGFCGEEGVVSEFLSLAEPTRPTRVIVRVHGLALR